MPEEQYIERHIILGLIVSTDYIKEIRDTWNPRYLKSHTARKVASWCLEYYDTYKEAPQANIESIYFEKLKAKDISEDLAEEIEYDILPDLSDEFERADTFNLQYLLDRTSSYFSERNLELHREQIDALVEEGRIKEAEEQARNFNPIHQTADSDLNLSDKSSLERVGKAFDAAMNPLMEYPGAVGEMLNPQLTRDALVAFLAPEKRGKSFVLLDLARRAVRQRLNVAFFQAGDMSEAQQLRRLGIHLAKRSDRPEYTGPQWEAVKDCKLNQTGDCDKEVREVLFGLEGEDAPHHPQQARQEMTFEQLKNLYEENPDYRACHNCTEYQQQNERLGCTWIQKVNTGPPLQKEEAQHIFEEYFVDKRRQFMLSTHPNNTLSVEGIEGKLDHWYQKGFVPDVIVVDYADLLTATTKEFRHAQDEIWKGMRRVSEERHCLFVTATQADARSYQQGLLTLSNFSEDKRKYAHVTAMYGLNQDPGGREKNIGIMRINELVIREGTSGRIVHVLQNLKRGQPILTSYW